MHRDLNPQPCGYKRDGPLSGKWKNERRRRLNIKMKTSKFSTIILKDNVLEYVALRGSDRDVNKETRRFVAASKDSAVEELSKDTVYSRVDLVNILSVATVGEIREYERGPWVYIPENPKDHPNLIQFYKKYHPVRYLETVIHGYPKHFTEEDVRNAPKTMPKSFIEFLLKRGCSGDIRIAAHGIFWYLKNLGVPGLDKKTTLDEGCEDHNINVKVFLSTLNKMGLHVGDIIYTQALKSRIPRFVEEYKKYEDYMQTTKADKFYYSTDAQKAAKILAEGFQSPPHPDNPFLTGRVPKFPPTEVADIFEYFLYYGSERELKWVDITLRNYFDLLDLNQYDEYERFNPIQTRSNLQIVLSHVNPGSLDYYHELQVKEEGLSTIYTPNRPMPMHPPVVVEEDIRDHPALAKYYKRFFVLNYIDMIAYKKESVMQGPVIWDEIESACPANRLEYCLKYGTEKEVHIIAQTLVNRNAEQRLKLETSHPLLNEKKNKDELYTRGELRLMLTLLPQLSANFDPNEDYGMFYIFNTELLHTISYTEIVKIKYATQKDRDTHIRETYELGEPRLQALIEGFGPPPYTKEQHRAVEVLTEKCYYG
jgi:hypothetical protein